MIVQSCFVSTNCKKDLVSCFSILQDHIESCWLDFLHEIEERVDTIFLVVASRLQGL